MCQPWSLIEVRFKCREISAADMAPLTSCLFANISTLAILRSWGEKERAEGGREAGKVKGYEEAVQVEGERGNW